MSVLWVPRQYAERPLACTVPGCEVRFYADQKDAWQRHVGNCARANMDRIKAATKLPAFMEDYDPEISQHMRGVGERMIEEGRLEIKANERAGFS
jgi:hypothetical protein